MLYFALEQANNVLLDRVISHAESILPTRDIG